MKRFLITFGPALNPRKRMEVHADNQQRAGEQADCMREGDERVSVKCLRDESATEYAQRRERDNDARAFSIQLNGSGVRPS